MNGKAMRVLIILAVGVFFLSAGTLLMGKEEANQLTEARINLTLRSIGHQLLLRAGDSSSRVLPVKRSNESTFYLEFQSPFSFVPDTLVRIVHRNMQSAKLPMHYMVNVLNCTNVNLVVYGYEYAGKKEDLIPCQQRVQPMGCYVIQVVFPDYVSNNATSKAYVWLTALSAMVLIAFVGGGWMKKEKKSLTDKPDDKTDNKPEAGAFIPLGKYAFYDSRRILKAEGELMELSDKECRLLKIFATRPNQTIDREQLLKEVWEDDGVFVGRSLDVFVSKLRKRLQGDASLRLVNVHGKGYKLETNVTALA